MQTQYASTQTNQTAILHSRLKCRLSSILSCYFMIPYHNCRLPTTDNEYQLSACTFWLWLMRLFSSTRHSQSLLYFRKQMGCCGESSGWIIGPLAALTRLSDELPALRIVQILLLREDPWPPPCDAAVEAGS